jgi:hypothetical protein
MSYSLQKPTGSFGTNPIPVEDNLINSTLFDSTNNVGVLLVGRNAIDYGKPIAQNIVQMVSNFSGTVAPIPDIALQGQLWFQTSGQDAGKLFVRITAGSAVFPAGWDRIVTVSSTQTGNVAIVNPGTGTEKDGDILVQGSVIYIRAAGAWRQVFPAVYS